MNEARMAEAQARLDALLPQTREIVNWPTPGSVGTFTPGNKCGNFNCNDLPDEPGPCAEFEGCECDFPTVASFYHCKKCQHAVVCHFKASFGDLRDALAALKRVRALPKLPIEGGTWSAVDAEALQRALDGEATS